MKFNTCIFAAMIMLVATPALSAQEVAGNHSVAFSWGVSVPVGSNNFIDAPTLVAPALSYEYRFAPNFSVGGSVGYSCRNEELFFEGIFNGDLVSSNIHRKLSLVPVEAQFHYFPLGAHTAFQPYVGVLAGAQYAEFSATGDLVSTSGASNWGAVVTPNVGLRYQPKPKGLYADLRVGWQYSTNGWAVANNNKSQQNAGVRLGVGFSF